MIRILILSLWLNGFSYAANKVGTGDDGSDLEGAEEIKSGPIWDARGKAVQLLQKLNTAGISGLGQLLPEVERASLYLAKKDVPADLPEDESHKSMMGTVFARTQPRPHAPVRFFPVSKGLGEDQLVALHIHEGMHRALPEEVREDEAIVAKLTLALTTPEATHDQVVATARSLLPATVPLAQNVKEEIDHYSLPSQIGYQFRRFSSSNLPSRYHVKELHILQSDLYPFGGKNQPVGFGIEMSWMRGAHNMSHSGPLGLSARTKIWSVRDFDVSLWGKAAFSTLASDELKNSPFGRDVYTVGVSFNKQMKWGYIENYLSYDFPGTSHQKVGLINYQYDYGSIVEAKVRVGTRLGPVHLGGFGELHLANSFRVKGGAYNEDFGKYRILSIGPEVSFRTEDFTVGMVGRYLVDASPETSYDVLGNILGPGASQGSLSFFANVNF
jgi:hypothetical protein